MLVRVPASFEHCYAAISKLEPPTLQHLRRFRLLYPSLWCRVRRIRLENVKNRKNAQAAKELEKTLLS
jgi:hypothetical protein